MRRSVVITGVSTGIGAGIVGVLIENGWRVFGSVRRRADGDAARAQFGEHFHAVTFDVTDEAALEEAREAVRAELKGGRLHGLINNAGVAVQKPMLLQSRTELLRQLDINLIGPFNVIKAFAPLLTESAQAGEHARIINISSIGGRFGPPFLSGYAASKHGLEGLSESLRRELRRTGIDVIVIRPGAVRTPIWTKSADNAALKSVPDGSVWSEPFDAFTALMRTSGADGAAPESIGKVVLEALNAARPRLYYTSVKGKFLNWTVPLLLPRRIVDGMICRQLGLVNYADRAR